MTRTEIKQSATHVNDATHRIALNDYGNLIADALIAADELIDKLEAENQALKADVDSYADETSRLATEVVGLQADKEKLREALESVKQACLFADDDDYIGVTEDPHIPSDLFDTICAVLKDTSDEGRCLSDNRT